MKDKKLIATKRSLEGSSNARRMRHTGNLPGVVSVSGELAAEKRVNVSPKRQGVIEDLYVEEGDQVRRGQALARMDRGDDLCVGLADTRIDAFGSGNAGGLCSREFTA